MSDRIELRLTWSLEQLPDLVEVMRERLTPSLVQSFKFSGGGGDKARLPLRGEVLDDLTVLWELVVDTVTALAEAIHEELTIPTVNDSGATGLDRLLLHPAEQTPKAWHDTAKGIYEWVKFRASLINTLDDEGDESPRWLIASQAELLCQQIKKTRSHYMPRAEQVWLPARRYCPVCASQSVGVTFVGKQLVVQCQNCGLDVIGDTPAREQLEEIYLELIREEMQTQEGEQA